MAKFDFDLQLSNLNRASFFISIPSCSLQKIVIPSTYSGTFWGLGNILSKFPKQPCFKDIALHIQQAYGDPCIVASYAKMPILRKFPGSDGILPVKNGGVGFDIC